MTSILQKTIDSNTNPILNGPIVINKTSVKISNANTRRINLYVHNDGPSGVWIKLQPAAIDNLRRGIFLASGAGRWIFLEGERSPVEISAINSNATITNLIYVTEI